VAPNFIIDVDCFSSALGTPNVNDGTASFFELSVDVPVSNCTCKLLSFILEQSLTVDEFVTDSLGLDVGAVDRNDGLSLSLLKLLLTPV